MRSIFLIIIIISATSSLCFATYSFSDNFDDGIVNSSFWNVSGNGVSESGGSLHITRDNTADSLSSKNSFCGLFDITFDISLIKIDSHDMLIGISLTKYYVGGPLYSPGISFGFSKYGKFYSSKSAGLGTSFDYSDSFTTGDTYTFRLINGMDNVVHLYVDNSELFTRSFDVSDNYYVHFPGLYYDDQEGNSTIINIDNFSITVNPSPEPTSMCLLALGSLILRKRKP